MTCLKASCSVTQIRRSKFDQRPLGWPTQQGRPISDFTGPSRATVVSTLAVRRPQNFSFRTPR